jgi:CDP-glycerol glycerophosphotransferase (TagB/SpsB family)
MVQSKAEILAHPLYLVQTIVHDFRGEIAGQFADYILAATADDAALLRASCPQAKEVVPVGNPRFDEMVEIGSSKAPRVREDIRNMLNVPQRKKILLFLSSSETEHGALTADKKTLVYAEILGILHSLDHDYHIVVKLHPLEREFVLSGRPDLCNNVTVMKSDLSKLIVSSDLVLTWPSTAMINVVLAHKPMIVIDVLGDLNEAGLMMRKIVEYGCCLVATSVPELNDAIRSMTEDETASLMITESQRRFETEVLATDGKSANRMAKFIVSIPLGPHRVTSRDIDRNS